MTDLALKTGTIVTRNEEGRIDVEGGTIKVIPAWQYLHDLPETV